jgi:iduronate 2-sulfatase
MVSQSKQNSTGFFKLFFHGLNFWFLVLVFMLFPPFLNAQEGPNVLLIISDDLNTRIGPYMDIDDHTPHLDRLAKQGVTFSHAYSQYPVCGPSRASFMSGLYPETNGILSNSNVLGSYKTITPALENHPSLAGFFRERGYYTARVSKVFHMGVPGGIERGDPGGDEPDSWDYAYNVMGPETLSSGNLELLSPKNLHYGGNLSRMVIADSLKFTQTDYLAASQAIAILENRTNDIAEGATNLVREKPDAPFFLAVGFVRPHVPFIAPESSYQPYPEYEVELPDVKVGENVPEQALRQQNEERYGMNDRQKRRAISAYMASVRFMDEQVGRLLDALDRLGIREETIVIFISDHGFNLGEHDSWSKLSLWEGSVRAPLIISAPGQEYEDNYGTTSQSITEFIDLYPTVTELTGYSAENPDILQGKSLAGIVAGHEAGSPNDYAYTVSYQGSAASIRTERWRYTRWGEEVQDGNEELYDHRYDPEEHYNLIDAPETREVLEKMRNKLDAKRQEVQLENLINSKD